MPVQKSENEANNQLVFLSWFPIFQQYSDHFLEHPNECCKTPGGINIAPMFDFQKKLYLYLRSFGNCKGHAWDLRKRKDAAALKSCVIHRSYIFSSAYRKIYFSRLFSQCSINLFQNILSFRLLYFHLTAAQTCCGLFFSPSHMTWP